MQKTVIEKVKAVVKKYKTNDPYELIEALGIELIFDNAFDKLKGFYTVMNRQAYIVINGNLSESKKKIVVAHELGHHILHKHLAKRGVIKEFELYDMTARSEFEANSFAAELLIDDSDILELIYGGYDMEQISKILDTDINLIGIKIANFNMQGEKFNIGIKPKNNFLKTMTEG